MQTLFPVENNYPDGFSYTENFITADEENDLIEKISKVQLHNFSFQGYTANRKIASFGYDYHFDNGSLTKGAPIPVEFDALIEKVAKHIHINKKDFTELLVTEYPVGAVINWHRDAPPFDVIAGISLGADCTFKLRPYDKSKQGRGSTVSIPVKRRSLYIIRGEARTDWQHSIAPVKQQRYSITLRTLRE